jgi:serine/threonine-protein kinase
VVRDPEITRPSSDPLMGSGYRALARLGIGGSAEVYEAEHLALRKRVVVKILIAELAESPVHLERMRVEAQTLARLSHPNLATVFDRGRTACGRPFFVMEYEDGRTLLDELRARDHLPVAEAVAIVQQLLAGLSAAHAVGVIHRDIKLENLFLCDPIHGERTLKILDFGIAKVLPEADPCRAPMPTSIRTQEEIPLGTPRFLSPEQALCLAVDERTDVYGAGMVLYELLVGRDPFFHVDGYIELLQAHVSEEPFPPSCVASQPIEIALDDVVLRALAKRPEDRYATAADFSAALAHAVAVASRAAPPVLLPARETVRPRPGAPPLAPLLVPTLRLGILVVLCSVVVSAVMALLISRAL